MKKYYTVATLDGNIPFISKERAIERYYEECGACEFVELWEVESTGDKIRILAAF